MASIAKTRARMDDTVDELADRLRPRSLLEEMWSIVDWDSETGARVRRRAKDFGARFVTQVERQPVPTALVGIGLAWLAFGGRERHPAGLGTTTGSPRSTAGEKLGAARDKVSSGWEHTKHAVSSATHAVSSAAEHTGASVSSAVRGARDGARRLGEGVRSGYAKTRHGFERVLEDAPLAIGAGAAALGLLSGLLLPRTRTEDHLVGDASDRAKERAKQTARDAGERVAETAEDAARAAGEAVKDTVESRTQRGAGSASRSPGGHDPSMRTPRGDDPSGRARG